MNPGEVQSAGEDFLAQILGRIDDGEDPIEFLVRVLGEELTETRQDLTQRVDALRAQVAFDLDDKGRVLLGVRFGENNEFEGLSCFRNLTRGLRPPCRIVRLGFWSSKAEPEHR